MMAKVRRKIVLLTGLAVSALVAVTGPAAAQVTDAQREAIRANCRSDFLSHCRGVQPGGQAALACLQENNAKLSQACQQAVGAIGKPAGSGPRSEAPLSPTQALAALARLAPTVMAQMGPMQLRNLRMACAGDVQILCVGRPRDPQSSIACLRENAANLSSPCQQALSKLAAAAPAAAPAAAAATPGGIATAQAQAQPTAAQQSAIRSSCRGDFQSLCVGVQPGGQAALACLQQNAARLSSACKQAMSAVSPPAAGPAAAAPTVAPKPAAAAPTTAAAAQPTAEQQNAVRSNCRGDFQSLCVGVQPGGQAAMACLQQNAARLTPACKQAVGAISPAAAAPAAAAPAAAPKPAAAPARPAAPAAAAAPTQPATAAPAAAAAGTPESEQIARLTTACGGDIQTHCKGVSLGSGRVMACLAANGPSLSAQCRGALAAVSQSR